MDSEKIIEMLLDKNPSLIFIIIAMMFFIKFNPITTLTSLQLERKFYSKERNFFQSVIIYSFFSVHLTITILILAYIIVFLNISLKKTLSDILSIIGIILYIIIFWSRNSNMKKESYMIKIKDFILNKEKLVDGLLIYWIIIISFYTSNILYMDRISKEKIGVIVLTVLIFSISITFFLVSIGWLEKADKKFSIIIKDNNEKWYILHKINKEELLLGDDYEPSFCKKYRIVKQESLLDKNICSEKINNMSEPEYYI